MSYDETFKSKAAQPPRREHSLSLSARGRLSLSGVEEVGSFDEREISLITSAGALTVGGEDLSISRLDVEAGEVEVQGTVSLLRYSDAEPGPRGLWGRLLH